MEKGDGTGGLDPRGGQVYISKLLWWDWANVG